MGGPTLTGFARVGRISIPQLPDSAITQLLALSPRVPDRHSVPRRPRAAEFEVIAHQVDVRLRTDEEVPMRVEFDPAPEVSHEVVGALVIAAPRESAARDAAGVEAH